MTENTRVDGNNNNNNKNNNNTTMGEDVQNMKTQINQLTDLVQILTKNDRSSGDSLHLLKENVKKLIYNQQVLENKLDDCLKNQFNTDQVVNDLNWKLSRLLQESSAMKRSFQSEGAFSRKRVKMNGVITKPKGKGSKQYDEMSDFKHLANIKNGGLPQLDENSAAGNNNYLSGAAKAVAVAAPSIVLLPNAQIQIPKSKRHFTDPVKNGKLLVSENSLKKLSTTSEDFESRVGKNVEQKPELTKLADDSNKNLRRSSRRSAQSVDNVTTNKETDQTVDKREIDLDNNIGVTIVECMGNGEEKLDEHEEEETELNDEHMEKEKQEELERKKTDNHNLETIEAVIQEDQLGTPQKDIPLSNDTIKKSRLDVASEHETGEFANQQVEQQEDKQDENEPKNKVAKDGDDDDDADEDESAFKKLHLGHDLRQSAKEIIELNKAKLQAIRDEEKDLKASKKQKNQESLTRSSSISSSSSSSSYLSSSSKVSLATTNLTEGTKMNNLPVKTAMQFKELTPHSALIQNSVDIPNSKDMPLIDVNEEDDSDSDADADQEHGSTKLVEKNEKDKQLNDTDRQFGLKQGMDLEHDKDSHKNDKTVDSEKKQPKEEAPKELSLSGPSKTEHNDPNENSLSSDDLKDDSVSERTESPPLQDFFHGDHWSAYGRAQVFSRSGNSKQTSLLTGQMYYTGKPTLSNVETNVISQSNPLFHHQNEIDKLTDGVPLTLDEAMSFLSESEKERLSSQKSSSLSASSFLTFPVELKMVRGVYYRVDTGKVLTRDAFMELKYRTSFYPKWNSSMEVPSPITVAKLMKVSQIVNGYRFYALSNATMQNINEATRNHKGDKLNEYLLDGTLEEELEETYEKLSHFPLTESFFNTLPYFLMEFRWENLLISRKFDVAESKRTWQRRKALFALLHAWREKTIKERTPYFGKDNNAFTLYHCVRELEAYRKLLGKSVSWFYNHITMLRIILFELFYQHGDNLHKELQEKGSEKQKAGPEEFWREWMFPKDANLP